MIAEVLLLLGGFGALYFGADWMVRGAARLEGSLGLSPIVIGLTVVSVGTSAPELIVCVLATLKGSTDLAVGNVLGSNLANIGLILGVTALVRPLLVVDRVVRREIPIMLAFTLLLFPIFLNHTVDRLDGAILVLLMVGYLLYVFQLVKRVPSNVLVREYRHLTSARTVPQEGARKTVLVDLGLMLAGGLGLLLGGEAIVASATFLARVLGISELVVGLTMVAVGTSLPELATSVMAAARNQTDIAVGNVIGSNIFNITAVLGISSLVNPLHVERQILNLEFPAVVLMSFLALFVPIFPSGRKEFRISRREGGLLLVTYLLLGYLILLT